MTSQYKTPTGSPTRAASYRLRDAGGIDSGDLFGSTGVSIRSYFMPIKKW